MRVNSNILEIVLYGDPILRKKGQPVGEITGEVRELAERMLATMYEAQGVGLAAQQIGEALQLAVVDISAAADQLSAIIVDGEEKDVADYMPLFLIDAEVSPAGKEKETALEGCLSFPEITGDINRPLRVKLRTRTLDGGTFECETRGWLARAIQHEYDHLQGVLFIDRMSPATKVGLAGKLKRMARDRGKA